MNKINQNKAFTLVETLVAISILMIAIAGPLTVANKAYTSAIDARNQSVASNLAQEGLEYVNNMKANNTWPDDVSWVHSTTGYPDVPGLFNSCKTACDDSAVFTKNMPVPVPFVRNYRFKYNTANIFFDADQVLVTVTVSWSNGGATNSVQLQEILTDFER